ncbi:MAG: hypothetical protein KAS39_04575, partial [Actinomycetia bacterium]|nr:hypothetical protein [Actinomycetes bacterium]
VTFTLSSDEQLEKWSLVITDVKNNKIKEFSGIVLPKKIKWNGFDLDEMPVRINNDYIYELTFSDRSGNKGSENGSIRVEDLIKPKGDISTDDLNIDPPGLTDEKLVNFKVYATDNYDIYTWEVDILNEDKKSIKKFKGSGTPPVNLSWDGYTDDLEPMKINKKYYYKLTVKDFGKNTTEVLSKKFIIATDNEKPVVKCGFTIVGAKAGVLFSPDGDKVADTVDFNITAEDNDRIRKWILTNENKKEIIFKTFHGQVRRPKKINWNGIGDDNILVANGDMYSFFLEAEDFAGNRSVTEKTDLEIDILLVKTKRGFRMNFSNITFASGSANLDGAAYGLLQK